ncbi:MAG: hypothetical protein Q7T11_01400 [Deltaproteobacteria bacterium]|nr:hypothetical protein [Deltaproteobacteria bacterium]
MNSNSINGAGYASGAMAMSGLGNSPVDLMAYVETLLIQDYNDQMREMAFDIKQKTRIKQAYREHKIKVNNLLSKEQNDGKVNLTAEEYALLNGQPDYRWDESMNDGAGGVRDYNPANTDISSISNSQYVEAHYNGTNVVAPNQTATWHGDPHFNDADSAQVGMDHHDWDFQGVAGQTYTYLQDSNLNMTATHAAYGDNGATVVGSVNIQLLGPNGNSEIAYNANGTPTLDGKPMTAGQSYTLSDGGRASFDGSALTVTSREGYTIILHDEGSYLNGEVKTGPRGVESDGISPTGVIGAQFDADNQITAVQGNGSQYLAPGGQQPAETGNHKVSIDQVKSELERLQMRLDGCNSETEMAQTELSTVTSQRKLAFETMSTMLSKVYEASSAVVRNIK